MHGYLPVNNSKSAFAIPVEGSREKQDAQVRFNGEEFLNQAKAPLRWLSRLEKCSFNGEEFLNQAKVLTKRIIVSPVGDGSWISTVADLKADARLISLSVCSFGLS